MLLLVANYSVYLFFGIKLKNTDAATLVNLSIYFLCYWLLSSVLTTLLSRLYITKYRLRTRICLWILFSILSGIVLLLLPKGGLQATVMFASAAWLIIYGLLLARRLLRAHHRVIHIFDGVRADDTGVYIKWLSVFVCWTVTFGVECGLPAFLPDGYAYIWILSSVLFYIYLFLCYLNYLLFCEQMENAMEGGIASEEEDLYDTIGRGQAQKQDTSFFHVEVAKKIKGWIDADDYVRPGLTIEELLDAPHTNRTYPSTYIKTTRKIIPCEWITGLRLEYAKNILKEHPETNIQKLAKPSDLLSRSNFIKSFTEREGCTPDKWKKVNLEQFVW